MYRTPPKAKVIFSKYSDLLKGKLRSEKPAWFQAMELYPVNPSVYKCPSHFETSGKLDFETGSSVAQPGTDPNSMQVKTRSSNRKKHMKRAKNSPQKIVYPEDRLRRTFYAKHVFETSTPMNLKQTNLANEKWDSVHTQSFGLSGESVVRYQLHLIHQGYSESEAYTIATTEFYRAKAAQELETKIAAQEAENFDSLPIAKINSLRTIEFEEEMLKISKKVILRNSQMIQSRQAAAEKTFSG
ncbi:37S ribosomal protein S25, mitochondrial [Smittium mucronatum]|uniref:Small ribosomal subunit protein mS23 n=1 Tax=Smittium mucronatum TaxID=133383 RepID=A0A1R0GXJ6_9FUNG|nr:37S ribosomal protein S25, mitochondrial [Smittium mucronatum]